MDRTFMTAVVAFILTAGIAGSGAEPFEDGWDAFVRKDYATAMRLWRPLADQGNADAQYFLGVMYDGGWGVLQDYAAAASWYQKAADQGNANAQHNLAVMYSIGRWGAPLW